MKYREFEGGWGFYTKLAAYGWMAIPKKYTVILTIPGHTHFTIYNSNNKPWIKNVNFISAMWSPFMVIWYVMLLILSIAYLLLFEFHHIGLITHGYTTDGLTKVSGWVSGVLSIIGIIAIILYFTSHLKFV